MIIINMWNQSTAEDTALFSRRGSCTNQIDTMRLFGEDMLTIGTLPYLTGTCCTDARSSHSKNCCRVFFRALPQVKDESLKKRGQLWATKLAGAWPWQCINLIVMSSFPCCGSWVISTQGASPSGTLSAMLLLKKSRKTNLVRRTMDESLFGMV